MRLDFTHSEKPRKMKGAYRLVCNFACCMSLWWVAHAKDRLDWPEFDRSALLMTASVARGAESSTSSAYEEWERSIQLEEDDESNSNMAMEREEPHPLRTQDWRLQVRVSPWERRQQDVTFHRNGTMWTKDGERGDWWFDVGGLYWDMNTTVRDMPTVLHHKAELHWNIFGEQPRMFRGTVTRDRLPRSLLPPWLFRPVVGSFVGSGIGNDTADKSYRHRQAPASGEDNATPPRASPQTDRY